MNNVFKVEFDLPFVIHLTEEPISVLVDAQEFRVWLSKVDQPHQDPRLGMRVENSDLDKDRHGWVRYTHVLIEFDRALTMEDDEVAVSRALEAVNVIIEHYRDATDTIWVRPLAVADLPAPTIVWPALGDQAHLTVNKVPIGDWRPRTISIHPDLETRIRNRARAGERVSAHRQMLADARDALLQGNSRLAVIIGQSGVENAADESLLSVFRQRNLSLDQVRQVMAEGRQKSRWMSPEDAVRWTSIDSKLSSVLARLGVSSVEDDPALWLEWDVGNATRNSAIHAGAAPPMAEADDAVRAFGRIIRDYLEPLQADGAGAPSDVVQETLKAIQDVTGGTADQRLIRLIEQTLPGLGQRIVFHHKNFHPRRRERLFDVAAEPAGEELHIWIDPSIDPEEFAQNIAGVVIAYGLKAEGFPRARPGSHFPHNLFSRQVWELLAKELEMSILHLAESRRLADAGFDVDSVARKSLEFLSAILESDDYEPIDPNDLRAKMVPLQLMSKAVLLAQQDRAHLLELVARKDPHISSTTAKLIRAVEHAGFETREQAVRAMVACHDLLLMLDTCVVIDDVACRIYGSQSRTFGLGERHAAPQG